MADERAALIAEEGPSVGDIARLLARHWKPMIAGAVIAGAAGYGISYLFEPRYTATLSFMPPQQSQSGAAAALASLGNVAAMAGGLAGMRAPADQYVSLMQSVTVSDRIIDAFDLMRVYELPLRATTRKQLNERVQITVGKKDGLIYLQVEDTDPKRAADIANRYVPELRKLSDTLAITETQQRRAFFQQQLELTRDNLTKAQTALQASNFGQSVIRAEPKAALESYARLRAEVTTAEVRLQTLRRSLTDTAPEVQQAQAAVAALRGQLVRAEAADDPSRGPDYVSKYREYRYQETLFEMLAKQFELARVEEAREGSLFQVVDPASPPEQRSSPRRGLMAGGGALAGLLVMAVAVLGRRRR